ncbi:MAG TPA: oxidoreductase [Rhodobacteraceae bacterium]|nr:oxidoreductase [Paracoccaceae bacterium]
MWRGYDAIDGLDQNVSLATVLGLGLAEGGMAGEAELRISDPENGIEMTLDDAALSTLDQQSFETSTIWTDRVQQFAGPSLLAILNHAGITEGTVRLEAANDYAITIPVAELSETAPIVANRIDGEAFSLRQKGPLWVAYPYDSKDAFQSEEVYARSIWQLVAVERVAPAP